MATIYTSCPNTGRDISTGVEIEPECFADLPDVITRVHCPHCGERHNWSKYNVFLREGADVQLPRASTGEG
jgi:hypothetical protein